MSVVIGKSVNFLLTKFTPKAGQIYPQGVKLPPVENPLSTPTLAARLTLHFLENNYSNL